MATTRRPATALAARNTLRNSQKLSPLNLPLSRRNRNSPSRKRTAAKYPTLLRVGVMVNHRISGLWRDPHTAARSLLLKVHFVQSPKIDDIVRHQFSEFFYASSAVLDQPWPEVAGACASESPVDGTIVGIGALSIEPHRPSRSMPTESCHPISSPAFRHRSACSEAPGRSPPSVWHSTGLAVRIDLPRSIRPVLVVGNDEPNTRPNAERRRATRRPPDRSGPAPQAGRRAGGDRNATPQNAGFPVANSGRRWHRISRVVS